MSKTLVVVESPAKAKTIEKFLGSSYSVKASVGHLRDLPKSQFGVDVDNGFEPKYINIRGKGDLIKDLKKAAKSASKVYLATDPDREGEAIAWHLAHILNLNDKEPCRIEFNEITKNAIKAAVKKPRPINVLRVDAQQARRILDRIVGYKLSPLLWRKVRKGLSAGRVQSVAVRLICDREQEIQGFKSEEYWSIAAKLRSQKDKSVFMADLVKINGKKSVVPNQGKAEEIQRILMGMGMVAVKAVKKSERRRNPAPPFTTSSLQQEAARRFGFATRKTMMLAQQLYEGLNVGRGLQTGLVTYIRTDSVRIADSAQDEIRGYIANKYGADFVPRNKPVYGSKKNTQDAHEAIRPAMLNLPPEAVSAYLSKDLQRLYSLIWGRFVASQMTPAVYDTMTVDIVGGQYELRANGSKLKFAGFTVVYTEAQEDGGAEKDNWLPQVEVGQLLDVKDIVSKQHFTQPPPRYSEASLVKILEELGIGRPSTYAPIIDTIVTRGYVGRAEKRFFPTELGCTVVDLLKQYFKDIVDVEFTAEMEAVLDGVAEGQADYKKVLHDFYVPFAATLEHAESEIGNVELPVEVSDTACELCGEMMVYKSGRYGKFLACPGFPKCRNTKPIVKDTGVLCPKCGGSIVEKKAKRGKAFYGCSNYPECDFSTWDMPLTDNCKECGNFMVRRNFKKGGSINACGNRECVTNAKVASEKKNNIVESEPAKKKDAIKTDKLKSGTAKRRKNDG